MRRADIFWAIWWAGLLLLFILGLCCFTAYGESVRGFIPAAFVELDGDTMTGTLILDVDSGWALQIHDDTYGYGFEVDGECYALGVFPPVDEGGRVGNVDRAWGSGRFVDFDVEQLCTMGQAAVTSILNVTGPTTIDSSSQWALIIDDDTYEYGWEADGEAYALGLFPPVDEAGYLGNVDRTWAGGRFVDFNVEQLATIAQGAITDLVVSNSLKMGSGPGYGLEIDSDGQMLFRPDFSGSWTALDLQNFSGAPGTDDYVWNGGDLGGLLDYPFSMNAGGIGYINELFPFTINGGRLGDFGTGEKWGEGGFLNLQCDTQMMLPIDIQSQGEVGPGVSTDVVWTLDYYEGTPNQYEDLVVGNADRGIVRITPYGEVVIDVYDVGDTYALSINGTKFDKDGDLHTSTVSCSCMEFAGLEGATAGYGYDLTDDNDDICTTIGQHVPTRIHGTAVVLTRVWVDIQSRRNQDYLTDVSVWQRNPTDNGVNEAWSQAVTLGQGDTDYHATYWDLPDLQPYRYYFVQLEFECGNTASKSVEIARVALSYYLSDNP